MRKKMYIIECYCTFKFGIFEEPEQFEDTGLSCPECGNSITNAIEDVFFESEEECLI